MKRIKQLSIVLTLALVVMPMVVLASPPAIPLLVWGNVTIDGQPASAGTEILAEINSEEVASTIVTAEGKYFIGIPDGKANEDKMVTFKVNGIVNASQLKCANIDTTPSVRFDLAVVTTRACSISNGQGIQTWNDSNGSWGDCLVESCNSGYHQEDNTCVADSTGAAGGGGGSYTPPTTPSPTIQGDINEDNKVDKYDFSLMMSEWGQTGSSLSGDLNKDGKVDKYDFALLMLNWDK